MKRIHFLLILLFLIIFSVAEAPVYLGGGLFNKGIFKDNSIKILNFGDLMFDRGVRNIIENKRRDPFEYLMEYKEFFLGHDFVIVNLEGPIVEMDRNLCQQKAYNFQFASNTPNKLKEMGINIVNIANNHSFDCYEFGFNSTKRYLKENGVDYFGDNSLEKSYIVKEINNKKIAFVGIDETLGDIPVSNFYPLIKKLKSENNYVFVNIHWGEEYKTKSNSKQQIIAHRLIDEGADFILGHHPHVIQEMEVYKNKLIFYSLGNFVFDQNFGETTKGLGVSINIKNEKIIYELLPFNIKLFAPDFMEGEEREKFCSKYLSKFENKDCRFEIKL